MSKRMPIILAAGAAVAFAHAAMARESVPPLKVSSSAFSDGGAIPSEYTCEGKSVAPPLSWSAVPPETKSIAVVIEDPDAPSGTFDHLATYNLPPAQRSLPTAAIGSIAQPGSSTASARNSSGQPGFAPICPPSGRHRYRFVVTALDAPLSLSPSVSAAELKNAIAGHMLARGVLVGTYESHKR